MEGTGELRLNTGEANVRQRRWQNSNLGDGASGERLLILKTDLGFNRQKGSRDVVDLRADCVWSMSASKALAVASGTKYRQCWMVDTLHHVSKRNEAEVQPLSG